MGKGYARHRNHSYNCVCSEILERLIYIIKKSV